MVSIFTGIFGNSYLPFEGNRNHSNRGPPSLEFMIEPAIKILRKNRNGFMMMVSTGKINSEHFTFIFQHTFDGLWRLFTFTQTIE